eukprot:682738-Pyramimonas_sp.AAC.1
MCFDSRDPEICRLGPEIRRIQTNRPELGCAISYIRLPAKSNDFARTLWESDLASCRARRPVSHVAARFHGSQGGAARQPAGEAGEGAT